MKKIWMIACCLVAAHPLVVAQVPSTLSEGAISFYNKAIGEIRSPLRSFIFKKSFILCNHRINSDSLRQHFKKELTREKISGTDLDGIVVLVMIKTSLNTDEELKGLVMAISRGEIKLNHKRNPTQAVAVKNATGTLSGEEVQDMAENRLELLMNQKSQIALQTNPLMGKISGMEDSIINHLR